MWYIHIHSTISNIEFPAISRVPKGKWQTLPSGWYWMTTVNMDSKRFHKFNSKLLRVVSPPKKILHWLPTSKNCRMSISKSATPTYFAQIWAIWVYQPKLCPKNPVVSYLTRNPFPQFWHTHTQKKNDLCCFQPDTLQPRFHFSPRNLGG